MNVEQNNLNLIRYQISRKNNLEYPYYATENMAKNILTDMDHFPYKRYFRSVYHQSDPRIMDREAGYSTRIDDCYKYLSIPDVKPHKFCWQNACTSVKPCKAPDNETHSCIHITP